MAGFAIRTLGNSMECNRIWIYEDPSRNKHALVINNLDFTDIFDRESDLQ